MISRPARFAIAAAVVVLDRLTKYWIETGLGAFDTITVIPGVFNIIHAQNRGAAFGIFNQTEGALRLLLLVGVSGVVMIYVAYQLWQMPKGAWPSGPIPPLALSLVLGGALGNLWDRVVRGSVTDFLQVFIGSYEWPAFNVADSAISVGAVLLLLRLWQTREKAA